MDQNHKLTKKEVNVKRVTLLFISIFLSILTLYRYVLSVENPKLIITLAFILSGVYFIVLSLLYSLYNKILAFFVMKLTKTKIKDISYITSAAWLFPSLICGVVTLILFVLSNYYVYLFIQTLEWSEVDYTTLVNIMNLSYGWIAFGFIITGTIIQSYLIKRENVKILPSILSSLLSIIIFMIIIELVINIIYFFIGVMINIVYVVILANL